MHGTQVYQAAKECIAALDSRCAASEGPYLLGSSPCSLDAKVYGLCTYILAAETIAPTLKEALAHAEALKRFLSSMSEKHFDAPAPQMKDVDSIGTWSSAGNGYEPPEAKPLTAEEKKQRRRSWWWLGGAAAILVGYVVFGGDYFQVAFVDVEEGDDEEAGEEQIE